MRIFLIFALCLNLASARDLSVLPADVHFAPYRHLVAAPAPGGLMLEKGDLLAICGDSITEQKKYSLIIEAYLTACVPGLEVTCRQFGWSGERADGFLKRMENDVLRFEPDVATTCYGMNDFRYVPRDAGIEELYRSNLVAVLGKFRAADCDVLIGSSGIIDSVPHWVKSATGTQIDLNVALSHFRNIALGVALEGKAGFADIYRPMLVADFEAKKRHGAEFKVAGKDGVHPGWAGQVVMAYAFLRGLGLDGDLGEIVLKGRGAMASGGHEVTGFGEGRVMLRSWRLPFCAPAGEVGNDDSVRAGLALVPFEKELNRLVLRKVDAVAGARYAVKWGGEEREISGERLLAGVNLAAEFVVHPLAERFQKVWAAVARKQEYETRQMKHLMHGLEGRADMEGTVALTEKVHAKMVAGLARAMGPVKHAIEVRLVE